MPTNRIKKISFVFLSLFVFLISFQLVNAQGIVPCGTGNDPRNACTLCHLIVGVFSIVSWFKNILITIAAVGIFASGVMYVISSGDEGMVTKAKSFLKSSLIGFIIVLMSWFFVNTIMWVLSSNSDLNIGKENWYTFSCSTKTSSNIIEEATSTLPSGTLDHANAQSRLLVAGIRTSSSGNCADQNNRICTSLNGLPEKAITNLIKIKETCNTEMTITGGTETGHTDHGTGKASVDLRWNESLASCIKQNASALNIKQLCTTLEDAQYRINCTFNEKNQHIHVSFN